MGGSNDTKGTRGKGHQSLERSKHHDYDRGAPVTQKHADEIGADIYAPDGAGAARIAKTVIQG